MAIIPILFIFILVLAVFIFWIVALIDVLRRQFPSETTKLIWVLVVLFGHILGAVIYYAIGRDQGRI